MSANKTVKQIYTQQKYLRNKDKKKKKRIGQNNDFLNIQNLEEFLTSRPTLQEMLKETLKAEGNLDLHKRMKS